VSYPSCSDSSASTAGRKDWGYVKGSWSEFSVSEIGGWVGNRGISSSLWISVLYISKISAGFERGFFFGFATTTLGAAEPTGMYLGTSGGSGMLVL
jgi:hypothetical protein